MKEIQYPVVNATRAGSKLVDPIAQEIGLRSTQLMTKFAKPFDPDQNLVLCMFWYLPKPFDERR